MQFQVLYCCTSHIGKVRSMNQDNYICAGEYMTYAAKESPLLCGTSEPGQSLLTGVFDGMGGEECGEIASLIAAQEAAKTVIKKKAEDALRDFCQKANSEICQYAADNDISAMGTTAALLAFSKKSIAICNIGDSKIFRFQDDHLEQLSVDHIALATYGHKPPLSQSLGIPPSEMLIDPYVSSVQYCDGDVYLICSDGLTDMLSQEEIAEVLRKKTGENALTSLLNKALDNGGKDNITLILCKIRRKRYKIQEMIFGGGHKDGVHSGAK